MNSKREIRPLKVWKKPKQPPRDPDEESIRYSNMNIVQKSPSECELHIQDGRIFSILRITIDKVKLAISLPELLERSSAKLKSFLKREQVQHIQNTCNMSFEKHMIPGFGAMSYSPAPRTRRREEPVDFGMAVVMETLWNNARLRQAVLQNYKHSLSNPGSVFINCLESLVGVMEHKLATTAADERERAIKLEQVQRQNASLMEKINKLESILKQQRNKLEAQLKEKLMEKGSYEEKIAAMVLNFDLSLHKTINANEKEMAGDTEVSALRQEELEEEARNIVQQYDTLLTRNILAERKLRARRLKVEQKVVSWLVKYDSDMWLKQGEFEEINKTFVDEKKELEELQVKFNKQEKKYVVLMKEKAEEEARILAAKVEYILTNRAARIIQKSWRAYRKRKLEKKLAAKKGKKALPPPPPPPPPVVFDEEMLDDDDFPLP